MTDIELILNMLAETTTTEFSKNDDPKGFEESKNIVKDDGNVVKNTREDIEKKRLGKKVIAKKTNDNSKLLDD